MEKCIKILEGLKDRKSEKIDERGVVAFERVGISVGKAFYVFRIGSGRVKTLQGSNAANSLGVASFIIRNYDQDYGHGWEHGDVISLFRVEALTSEVEEYKPLRGRNLYTGFIGISILRESSSGRVVWYSFPKSDGVFNEKFIKSVSLKELEETRKAREYFEKYEQESTGGFKYDNLGMLGASDIGDVVRSYFRVSEKDDATR